MGCIIPAIIILVISPLIMLFVAACEMFIGLLDALTGETKHGNKNHTSV